MVRVGLSHKETRLGRSSVGKSGSTHQAAPTGHTHPDRCQVEFSILFIATSAFAYSAWEGLTELDCPCQKPRHAMKEVLFEHRVLSVNTFPLSTIHRFMKTIALKTHSSSLSKDVILILKRLLWFCPLQRDSILQFAPTRCCFQT